MSLQTDIDEPEWPEILRAVQDQVQARIHTQCPGIVRSYDSTTQVAEIQLAVQLGGVNVPPLPEVPVVWPGGTAGFLHVPLAAGDTVMVLFSEEDFSKWYTTGSVSSPAVLARHGLHAIALPGLRRSGAAFAATGGHVTLASTGELRLGSDAASAFVALANLVDARFAEIRTYINGHVHATAGTGPPVIPTVLLGALDSVTATKVKAT